MLLKDNIQRHQLDFMTTFNERKGAMISLWAPTFGHLDAVTPRKYFP